MALSVKQDPVTVYNHPLATSVEWAAKSPATVQAQDGVRAAVATGWSQLAQLFEWHLGTKAVLIERMMSDHSRVHVAGVELAKAAVEPYVESDPVAAKVWRACRVCIEDADWKNFADACRAGVTA